MVKHLVKHPDNSLKGLYTTMDLERLFQVLTTQFYNYIRHQETQWLGDKRKLKTNLGLIKLTWNHFLPII